jgi:hypothetical protein
VQRLTKLLAIVLVAALAAGFGSARTSPEAALEGAWQWVDGDGLLLFTGGHYSWMTIQQPRELFADPSDPTDAEWLAACAAFIANSGTYEASGSTGRLEILVAKHPVAMAMRQAVAFEYSIEADTLVVVMGAGRATYTFARVDG